MYLIATIPGKHSGDQVHKVKENAALSFFINCAGTMIPVMDPANKTQYARRCEYDGKWYGHDL